jgi:hypothetical protein
VIASIQTSQPPVPFQVEEVQERIRQRLGRNDVDLLVRSIASTDTTAKGRILLGQAHFAKVPEDEQRVAERLEASGRTKIEEGGELFVNNIDAAKLGATWAVRADVVGPRVPDPARVRSVEAFLTEEAGAPVTLTVRARSDVVVTSEQYDSVDHLIEREARQQLENRQAAQGLPDPAGAFPYAEGAFLYGCGGPRDRRYSTRSRTSSS